MLLQQGQIKQKPKAWSLKNTANHFFANLIEIVTNIYCFKKKLFLFKQQDISMPKYHHLLQFAVCTCFVLPYENFLLICNKMFHISCIIKAIHTIIGDH